MTGFWRVTLSTPMTSSTGRFRTVDAAFLWIAAAIARAQDEGDVTDLSFDVAFEETA